MRAYCLFAIVTAAALSAAAQNSPIDPVAFNAVRVDDAFWAPRFATNRKVTIPYCFSKCEETSRIQNFAVAGGLAPGKFAGIPYNDSDVYKVIEGAAYSLATHPDPKLQAYVEGVIAKIAAAQEPDGYLYSARTIIKDGAKMPKMSGPERWLNLRSSHELYNVGHMYEAAAAWWQATGKRSLLDVAIKNAALIDKTFGPEPDKLKFPPGHEEIEIGLIKLHRATGDPKYLKLAKFFVDTRGRAEGHPLYGEYAQDHIPVAQQTHPVGHAVRAGYLYCGVTDVAALTGDAALLKAIDTIWGNVAFKKLYLTGGIGARRAGEAFGDDYELPNKTAYNETCAAIANALWNHRMFLLHGDAQYIDVLERVIYNGFLSGIALGGDTFFYPNPLESAPGYQRAPWFGTSCCPVNIVRFIPSIAGYVYATRDEGVAQASSLQRKAGKMPAPQPALYVNLYIGGEGKIKLGGQTVTLKQETKYPWDGRIKLTVAPEKAGEFELRLRVPGWAQGRPVPSDLYRYEDATRAAWRLAVNGEKISTKLDKGYAAIRRAWRAGDAVELELPMPVRRVLAHDSVKDDAGRVAIERGPIVFCAEGVDNRDAVNNLVLPAGAKFGEEFKGGLLGGVMTLKAEAVAVSLDQAGQRVEAPAALTMIPYYAWCHRGADAMTVWLARTAEAATPLPPPTIAGTSRASASFKHSQDALEALNDRIEPASSIDHSIPRFTWWDHKGTSEWVQYDFKNARTVSGVEVYWFDDTGRGSCRVPRSWRVVYKDGESWKPVAAAGDAGVKKNTYNRVTFAPVKTTALRLEVDLQPGFSGGILEWRVME